MVFAPDKPIISNPLPGEAMRILFCHKKFTGGLACLLLGTLFLFGAMARADVPEAGGFYLGGTKMEYPDSGVTFTLPKNTVAVASDKVPKHELTVGLMPQANEDNNLMVIQIGMSNYDALAKEFDGELTYNGIKLHPVGKATRANDGVVYNNYTYTDDGEKGASFAVGLVAKDGTAVIMMTLSPPSMLEAYRQAASEIVATVSVTLGVGVDASASSSGGPAVQAPAGNRNTDIVGAWMSRSNRGSGGIYIESASKWAFSADGTVAWGSGAVVAGGTAGVSIRGGGDNPPDYGAWATNGAALQINWQDGTQGNWTYEVFEDYNGTPTLALTTQADKTYYYRKID